MDESTSNDTTAHQVTTLPPPEKVKFLTKLKTFDFPRTKSALAIVGGVATVVVTSKLAGAVKNTSVSGHVDVTTTDPSLDDNSTN